MTARRDDDFDFARIRDAAHQQADAQLDAMLRKMRQLDEPSPDFTRQVMGRLGYMRVPAAIARRRRIRRWVNRGTLLAAMIAAVGAGVYVFSQSEEVRRPVDVTIPAAIGRDFATHQHRLSDAIRLIRESVPQPAAMPAHLDQRPDPANSVPAPNDVRLESEEGWPEPLDPAVDRSATAPIRWV